MPSFLNPLEDDIGGYMSIEVGSKWVRMSLYEGDEDKHQHKTYFLGQGVEVYKKDSDYIYYHVSSREGVEKADTTLVDTYNFLKHFKPLVIELENK